MPSPNLQPKNDIFISYRRNGGQEMAFLLYERLTRMGYRVEFDVETLNAGRFDRQILRDIENCRDFLLVLNPGALDRCVEEDDWVRREIACALAHKRNIVPLLLKGFRFPNKESLPPDIREVAFYNGVEVSITHFNDTFARIRERLKAKPALASRLNGMGMAIVLAGAVALGSFVWLTHPFSAPQTYPSTRIEVQQVNEVTTSIGRQIVAMETFTSARLAFISKARGSVLAGDPSVATVAESDFRRALLDARKNLTRARLPDEAINALRPTPIPVDVYQALFTTCEENIENTLEKLPVFVNAWTRHGSPFRKSDALEGLERAENNAKLDAHFYALGVIELFMHVRHDALQDFLDSLTACVSIPRLAQAWPTDMESLEREQNAVMEQLEATLRDLSVIVGNMNVEYAQERKGFEDALAQNSIAPERADELTGKISVLAAKQTELKAAEGRLAAEKAALYAKFKPLPSDEPGILWSKVLRFRSVNMQDAALEALGFLAAQNSRDFLPGAVRAMQALCSPGNTAPIDSGGMVSSYEPPATSHAVFQPGDIVVARDGIPVRRVSDWKIAPGSTYRFWRLGDSGTFQSHEAVLPPDQPRVGLVEITEHND